MRQAAKHVITTPKILWELVCQSVTAWIDDFAPSMGAAISYYTLFSIAPLLLIVIAIVGFVFGRNAATGQIFEQLRGLMGEEGAAAVQGLVKSASDPAKGALATVVGLVTLAFGATTVFAELQSALDRIWRSPAATKREGISKLIRTRLLSFGMILGVGFLLLVSLVLSAAISSVSSLWGPYFAGLEAVLQIVNFVFSLAIVTVLFALIYKLLPRARIGWHDVWIGAAVTAALFTIGKFLIGLYIGKSGIVSGFGAAGSLAVVLLWVYYSAQVFLLGAEFTWVYSYRYGSHRSEAPPQPGAAIAPLGEASRALPAKRPAKEPWLRRKAAPAPIACASDKATRALNRHPRAELALALLIGGIAAIAARSSRRLR